jgi:hypothetical protein
LVKTPNGQPPDARTEPPARRDDDDLLDAPDDRSHGARFWDWVVDIVRTWGPAMITVLAVRSVIAEPFRIPSGSMVPTLAIGDHILVTKYSYGLRWPLTRIPIGELDVPERGDVVVFVFPGSDEGKAVRFAEDEVRAMGRSAAESRDITLRLWTKEIAERRNTRAMLSVALVDGIHPAEAALIGQFYESSRTPDMPTTAAVLASPGAQTFNATALAGKALLFDGTEGNAPLTYTARMGDANAVFASGG